MDRVGDPHAAMGILISAPDLLRVVCRPSGDHLLDSLCILLRWEPLPPSVTYNGSTGYLQRF